MFVEKKKTFRLPEEKTLFLCLRNEKQETMEYGWKRLLKNVRHVCECVFEVVNISFSASEHRNVTYDPNQMVDARKYPIQMHGMKCETCRTRIRPLCLVHE